MPNKLFNGSHINEYYPVRQARFFFDIETRKFRSNNGNN